MYNSSYRRAVRAAVVAAMVLLPAAGVAAGYAYAGDIPRGTAVLGVPLGGLDRAGAAARLRAALPADRLTAPFTVRVDGTPVRVDPAAVGLRVDVEATIATAAAQRPHPVADLVGTRDLPPVIHVDADRLRAVLSGPVSAAFRPMVPPAIRFVGGQPEPVYPEPGFGLDPRRATAALRDGWLRAAEVSVPLTELPAATSTAEVDRLMTELAAPAVAAPVIVRTPAGALTLSPVSIGQSLVLAGDPAGRITPRVDPRLLRLALARQLARIERPPSRARIVVAGRAARVVASAGRLVDIAGLARALLPLLPRPAPRQVRVGFVAVQASGEAELAALGIRERVSTYTTRFTGGLAAARTRNIIRAAQELDGAIVKPGETFSMNGHTGPRGYSQGYVDAPLILEGKLVPGVGGGVSQVATTLFNAAYYAGLQDVEHQPHSYWFSRYPPVIESTIFYPTMDLKFRNDTRYGVLIDTTHTAGSVTVSMWSTRVYDSITTTWSGRRAFTEPQRAALKAGPDCIATDGIRGFTQDAWRVIRQGGKEVRREKFTWRYEPEPRYVCVADPRR